MNEGRRGVVFVCTMPRSGSNYLIGLCGSNGIASLNESLFNVPTIAWLNKAKVRYKGLLDPELTSQSLIDYIQKNQDYEGRAASYHRGLITIKMMNYHWARLIAVVGGVEKLSEYFGEIFYIHLKRDDVWRQAISHYIATHTGVWYTSRTVQRTEDRSKIAFNFEAINSFRDHIIAQYQMMDQFFEEHKIEPYRLSYEYLVKNHEVVFREIATRLQIPVSEIHNSDSTIQADELNEKFYQMAMDKINGVI